jgi:hypothetical protein
VRNYQSIINRATFLSSSPERVAGMLEARAAKSEEPWIGGDEEEALEGALIDRREVLINLALARYCVSENTARKLFSVAGDNEVILAIRLSVLSNEVLGRSIFGAVPVCLFESKERKEQLAAWLARACDEEIAALFSNPKIDNSFLRDFLEGKEYWLAVGDERRREAIIALTRNPRMRTPYSSRMMDGYAEYSYGSVFDAAWALAQTMPATLFWAATLSGLFEHLNPRAHSVKKPLEVAERWRPGPADNEQVENEAKQFQKGWCAPFASVRKALAKLALGTYASKYGDLIVSEDPAFRCAVYDGASLSAEEITAAYAKDGELFFNVALRNRRLWRTEQTRKALHDVAWDIANRDKGSHLDAPNAFNYMKDEIAKEYPDWFREENAEPMDPDQAPATKGDLNGLAEVLSNQAPYSGAFQQVFQSLKTLNMRIGWVWWFSLGALVAASVRHL